MSVNDQFQVEYMKREAPIPKLAIAIIFTLVASVVAMVVFMISRPVSTQDVVAGQELIIGVDNATVYVPKDAATMAGVITILPLTPNLYPDGSEWFRSQVVSVEYLDAAGTPYLDVTFPKPVLICFKIARSQWQDYTQNPGEYQVQYYAEGQDLPGWVALPMTTYADRYQLCGQTDHFSIFALAVIPQEEIPVTGGSTPTPTPTGSLSPTLVGTLFNQIFSPTPANNNSAAATPVSTQAALTATSVALTATDVPTNTPEPTSTNVPPTNTFQPTATDVPPTAEPPTSEPPTSEPPTSEPPTSEPPTSEPPTPEPPPDTPEPPPDTPEPPPPTVEP